MSFNNTEYFNTPVSGKDLETILEHLPRLVMLIGLDGTILYWNGGGEKVFGFKAEEIEGRPIWSLYHDRGKEAFERDLAELKQGKSISYEIEGRHKSGARIWLDVKRVMIESSRREPVILGTASDISLQKKAEFDLAKSQARTVVILDTAVEGIVTIDKQGLIQSFNKAAEEMFGYKADEVISKNVSMLMPSPYREEHDQYLENYYKTDQPKIIGIGREVRGQKKDGTVIPIELAVSEINYEGEVIFTGLITDISERRKLENKILEISEDERRRIGQDLHDGLGQMLSGIGLISRNLARKLKANGMPGAGEALEISEMIKEADEFARKMAHGLAHIELDNEGLEVAMHRLCNQFEQLSGTSCRFECASKIDFKRRSVPLHLYRITQEATNNAIKHGKATKISLRLDTGNNYLRLFIEDNGVGFSGPENLAQPKGMGIHTMRYRAHLLGGTLNLTQLPGGGTQVVCTVPLLNLESE